MKSSTTPSSLNRKNRQKKLREKNQYSSLNLSKDSGWVDQCNTNNEKPWGRNDTTMDVSPDGADVY
jgi:hypothetical protein